MTMTMPLGLGQICLVAPTLDPADLAEGKGQGLAGLSIRGARKGMFDLCDERITVTD